MKNIRLDIIRDVSVAALCALAFNAAHADTDWIILPGASESGRMLLHGIRDNSKPVATDIRFEKQGRFKSLRIGNTKSKFNAAGINSCGVAVLATGGDPHRDRMPKVTKISYTSTNAINIILRNCDTAEKAVANLRDGFKKRLITNGTIFLIADPQRAFAVECSPGHFASYEIKGTYCVYSSMWKMPEMQAVSRRSARSYGWSTQREWAAREMLQRGRLSGNTISAAESIAASRAGSAEINTKENEKARDKSPVNNTIANKFNADAFLFEIDKEFPGVLSCVYVAFGPARHTVYLPIAIGAAESLPAELTPAPWKTGALARLKATKPTDPADNRIVAFEKQLHAEFAQTREGARKLLREKNAAEAKKLLQEALQRQAADLNTFLGGLKNN